MGKDLKGKELGKYLCQRKDGRYMARFTDRFGKRVSIYADSYKEVKNLFNEELCKNLTQKNIKKNIKLNEMFEMWLEIYKRGYVRDTTLRIYKNVYYNHIQKYLGQMYIEDIKNVDILRMIKAERKMYSYENAFKIKNILSDIFDKAVENDLLVKNNAKNIRLIRNEEVNPRFLDLDEQKAFFECAKGTFYYNFFVVAVCTGLRVGELAALSEEDIDFENKEITVNKQLLYSQFEDTDCKVFRFGEPKTKTSVRSVPISEQCEQALKWQIRQKKVVETKAPKSKIVEPQFRNLIFTTKFNTPVNAVIISDAITKIVNEINLTLFPFEQMEDFSAHCFRRTFATRCFEADIPPKTVQAFLGHANLDMTMDLYTKVMPKKKQDDMKKLSAQLDKLDVFGEKSWCQNGVDGVLRV